ncbi:MAG: sporulation protein YtfJ [Clostridia bacterium]|nr:sporulation protein YtfJ [Clostridia bacterium]MBQ3860628.1 sporulation protein YtfJ [Clostridia bacterium]MBQ3955569.1 sporulation protein YtfJ [Clostridia bacterium]MBQ5354640.1 sporulation protein YtfJ [Clostridia bacterium]
MADNNRIGDITKTSLDSIRAMLDPNTVVGNPIETAAGTTIIPISKVSVGYASGGIDYAGKKDVSNKPNNFGGGGGTGVSVTPVAFLVVNKEGEVSVLNVSTSASSTAPADAVSQVVGFLERSPDLLERIKGVFSKKGEENKI